MTDTQVWRDASGSGDTKNVRLPVAASWNRALAARVDSSGRSLTRRAYDPEDALLRASRRVLRSTEDALAGTTSWIALTNPDGVVTYDWASTSQVHRRWQRAELDVGISLDERSAGTNGIGLALATLTPSLVRGTEHYIQGWDDFVCAASPIHHPITKELLGVVNISSLVSEENQHLKIALKALASAIRQSLANGLQTDHRRLLGAHLGVRALTVGSVITLDRSIMIVEDEFGGAGPSRAELWQSIDRAGPGATEIRLDDGRIVGLIPIDQSHPPTGYSIVFDTQRDPSAPAEQAGAQLGPIERAEREVILGVLNEVGWNKAEAATRLRISRGTLYARIRRYGLEDDPAAECV